MTRDELEFSISQYIDGALPPLERAALEEKLATDAEARAVLDGYRRLNGLVNSALPLPRVQWDRLAAQLSKTVAGAELPVRNYSLVRARLLRPIAIAASILIAVGIGWFAYRGDEAQKPVITAVQVQGPRIEAASGPVVQAISIGPAPTVPENWRYAEGVVSRRSRVEIFATGLQSLQDMDRMPY